MSASTPAQSLSERDKVVSDIVLMCRLAEQYHKHVLEIKLEAVMKAASSSDECNNYIQDYIKALDAVPHPAFCDIVDAVLRMRSLDEEPMPAPEDTQTNRTQ